MNNKYKKNLQTGIHGKEVTHSASLYTNLYHLIYSLYEKEKKEKNGVNIIIEKFSLPVRFYREHKLKRISWD